MESTPETTEVLPYWRDVLYAQGRTMVWLAKITNRTSRTVQAYHYGTLNPPQWWLEMVSLTLGVRVGGKR